MIELQIVSIQTFRQRQASDVCFRLLSQTLALGSSSRESFQTLASDYFRLLLQVLVLNCRYRLSF